ncbi:Hypothetical protein D9617_55g071590 [Elsinoe fawcettii]|nr:Hypothetical protein D9617_55g071590 [Elsinoe fawcettii]
MSVIGPPGPSPYALQPEVSLWFEAELVYVGTSYGESCIGLLWGYRLTEGLMAASVQLLELLLPVPTSLLFGSAKVRDSFGSGGAIDLGHAGTGVYVAGVGRAENGARLGWITAQTPTKHLPGARGQQVRKGLHEHGK